MKYFMKYYMNILYYIYIYFKLLLIRKLSIMHIHVYMYKIITKCMNKLLYIFPKVAEY